MAIIDHCGKKDAVADFGIGDTIGPILAWLRESIADDMWLWYDYHRDDTIVTLRKWIFDIGVKVRHLEPLFVILFGERE